MTEMENRVADAINSLACMPANIDVSLIARTAIEAMRHPIPKMVDELATAYGDCIHGFDTTWRVAIEIALGNGPDFIGAAIDNREK